MNAIGYARISTKDQSKYSLENQEDVISEYCQRNNLKLVALFKDNGESSDSFDRADFLALEEFIKKHRGEVRYLIIMEHDRFSRDLAEALAKIRELENKFKIKVLSADEPLGLDINDPDVFLQRAFRYLMANQELLKIRKRTRRSMHRAARNGRFIHKAPLGYNNARDVEGKAIIVPDKDKAPIVKKIFEAYYNGVPFFQIAKEIRKMGIPCKGNSTIQKILGNRLYAGFIRVPAFENKPQRYIRGLHKPLVAEFIYWRVQEMLGNKKTSKSQPKEDVPLRGILKCWCGRSMTSGWSKGKRKYYLYYRCTKHHGTNIPGQKLHDQFKKILSLLSLKEDQITYIKQSAKKQMKEALDQREKQTAITSTLLKNVEEKIDRLEEKMMNDEIESGTYKKWYSKYAEDKAKIERELNRLKQNAQDKWTQLKDRLPQLTSLPGLFELLPLRLKHRLINGVFKHGLFYSEGMCRTPWLHPAFSHNELILKKKGLLLVEQPNLVLGDIPLCSP